MTLFPNKSGISIHCCSMAVRTAEIVRRCYSVLMLLRLGRDQRTPFLLGKNGAIPFAPVNIYIENALVFLDDAPTAGVVHVPAAGSAPDQQCHDEVDEEP